MPGISFDHDFDPRYGEAVEIAPGIRRITAGNPGPFTFHGTNTYLIGEKEIAVIDPGPEIEDHIEAILTAAGDTPITHIIVTHTHRDHSPASRPLKAATGALIYGEGKHRPAREISEDAIETVEAGGDTDFLPDVYLEDSQMISGADWEMEAVFTPGHTVNHVCFGLTGRNIMICGDHVMGWSTTVIAPPDGSMVQYMASLDRLIARDETLYLPAHGNPIEKPKSFMKALKTHRKARELAILGKVRDGVETIPAIVRDIYKGLDPRLFGAAGLSVLAHLEDLQGRGEISSNEVPPTPHSRFLPAE